MTKFSDLNLDPKVLKAITEAGYESPTPIQAGAIPPALEGKDVLGIAQTGTGKTASFTLPMITLLAKVNFQILYRITFQTRPNIPDPCITIRGSFKHQPDFIRP